MKKTIKITFVMILAVLLLAVSSLTIWYMVERDRLVRSLSRETSGLVKQIQEYSFEDIKSYQKLVDECNRAISERSLKKSKVLLIKVDEKKSELDRLYQSINTAIEKKKAYVSFSNQPLILNFLPDFPSKDFEYQMNILETGLDDKDGDKIDSAINALDEITGTANNQLKNMAESAANHFLLGQADEGNEAEQSLIRSWQTETRQALQEGNYVAAYQIANRGEQFTELFRGKNWTEINAIGLNIESGQEGKLMVRIPDGIPPLESWMKPENCLLMEQKKTDAEYALCDVIRVEKKEPKPIIRIIFLYYDSAINGGYYVSNIMPRALVKSAQNDSSVLDEALWSDEEINMDMGMRTGGFYDLLYQIVGQNVRPAEQNVVIVSASGNMGNSSVGVQECIEQAKKNDIGIYIMDGQNRAELDPLVSETGGEYLKQSIYEFNDSEFIRFLENLYQKEEQVYSITYQTSGEIGMGRKITLDYLGEYNLRCEYENNSDYNGEGN